MTEAPRDPLRALKITTVINLILLSVQAWTGDVVNLFAAFPSGVVNGMGAFFQSLQVSGPGPLAIYHGAVVFLYSSCSDFERRVGRETPVVGEIEIKEKFRWGLNDLTKSRSGMKADLSPTLKREI